jgi:hypothetical protein
VDKHVYNFVDKYQTMCITLVMVYNNFAIFAGYQDDWAMGDMGILGLWG